MLFGIALNGQFEQIKLIEQGNLQNTRYFADVTGDGINDYIIPSEDICTGEPFIQIFEGQINSDKDHVFKEIYYSEIATNRFGVIDVDGNGAKEILVYDSQDLIFTLIKYDEGEFEKMNIDLNDSHFYLVTDINEDGIEELFYEKSDTFYVVNFDENLILSTSIIHISEESIWDRLIYDYNNDGLKDFYDCEFNEFFIYIAGEPNEDRITIDLGQFRLSEDETIIYDVDNNSDPDILFRPWGSSEDLENVYLAKNIRENGFSEVIQIGQAYPFSNIGVVNYVDVDYDGYPEIILETETETTSKLIELSTSTEYHIDFKGDIQEIRHYLTDNSDQYVIVFDGTSSGPKEHFYLSRIDIDEENVISVTVKDLLTPYYEGVYDAKISNENKNEIFFSFDNVGARNSVRSFLNEGFPDSTEPLIDINKYTFNVKFEDFNNDGLLDMFFPTDCEIIFNDGNNNYTGGIKLLEGASTFIRFGFGDVDNNGFQDIVIFHSGKVKVFLNTDGINFNSIEYPDLNLDFFSGSVQVVHLNQDDHLDILVKGFLSFIRLINNGDGTFIQEKVNGSSDFVYDYDKDVIAEVFLYYSLSGEGYFLVGEVAELGQSFLNSSSIFAVEGPFKNYDDFFIYDIDGDGDKDILTKENGQNVIEWFEVDGDSITYIGEIDPVFQEVEGVDLFSMTKVEGTINDLMFASCGDIYYVHGMKSDTKSKTIHVFADTNNNGIKDENEYGLSHYQFSIHNELTKKEYNTNSSGYRFVVMNQGSYFIEGNDGCFEINNMPLEFNTINDTLYIGASLVPDEPSFTYEMLSPLSRCNRMSSHSIPISNDLCDGTSISKIIVAIDEEIDISTLVSPWTHSIVGQEITFEISDLMEGQKATINFTVMMPSFELAGEVMDYTLKVFDDEDVLFSEQNYEQTLLCAFDPNDKSFTPNRSDTLGDYYITNEKISYLIRFQNVGNDTAFNVVVRDTLSSFLDISTFENVRSSHDYSYELDSLSREVVFTFNDILLVDSLTNEPESHGFIKFDIEPISNLPDFTQILNQASIYFDYNPPIHTNITQGIYLEDFSILETSTQVLEIDKISLYPNPTRNYVNIKIGDKRKQVVIYDRWGRKMFADDINNTVEISVSDWPIGLYVVKVGEELKKFVIME